MAHTAPVAASPTAATYVARDIAALCRCSLRHVWRMRDNGTLPPPIKVGSLVRWRREDIDAWIAGGCRPHRREGGHRG